MAAIRPLGRGTGPPAEGSVVDDGFDVVFFLHAKRVCRLAVLLGAHDPEAATQEAFRRLYARRALWRRLTAGTPPHLVRILVTWVRDQQRRELAAGDPVSLVEPVDKGSLVELVELVEPGSWPTAPAPAWADADPLDPVAALDRLDTRTRVVLVLRCWMELDDDTAGYCIGARAAVTRQVVSRGLADLTGLLGAPPDGVVPRLRQRWDAEAERVDVDVDALWRRTAATLTRSRPRHRRLVTALVTVAAVGVGVAVAVGVHEGGHPPGTSGPGRSSTIVAGAAPDQLLTQPGIGRGPIAPTAQTIDGNRRRGHVMVVDARRSGFAYSPGRPAYPPGPAGARWTYAYPCGPPRSGSVCLTIISNSPDLWAQTIRLGDYANVSAPVRSSWGSVVLPWLHRDGRPGLQLVAQAAPHEDRAMTVHYRDGSVRPAQRFTEAGWRSTLFIALGPVKAVDHVELTGTNGASVDLPTATSVSR
ncbi:MAG: hypothetical protein ACRDP1_15560 [Nocardioidaceae bacterium]